MATDETKYTKLTIEFLDNGFVVENYGYNPYGSDLKAKNVRTNIGEVIQDFTNAVGHNARIEAAKAEQEKKNAEEK